MTNEATVTALGERVWEWKERIAFRSADDIPRIAHDPSWLPAFDSTSVAAGLTALQAFRAEWAALDVSHDPIPVQVDHRLIGSALARTWWDLEVMRSWERDANFLLGQIVGPYVDLLLPRPPFDAARQAGVVVALAAIPAQVEVARENLARAGVVDLAAIAVAALDGVPAALLRSVDALGGVLEPEVHAAAGEAAVAASAALAGFAEWLSAEGPSFAAAEPVGRDRFVWYLRHVALIAAEPEALVEAAEQEYRRAVVGEALGRSQLTELPPFFDSVSAQVARQRLDEQSIRDFYERGDLLSQEGFDHYEVDPVPAYLAPLSWFAVNDDLTDAARPGTPGVAYTPDPGPGLPYFYAANARDPRLGIIHEGTHYQQLVRAWAHENPLRRRYYDSVANEGIAFYNEELMLQAGLFADSAHSRAVVQNFMRLRALRVVVDINLATGAFDWAEGVRTFVTRVPMDAHTAEEETAMYVATPGLAMSYQVGKLQLIALAASAIERQGAGFSFRAFHDWVWRNGNLPFSLQRWELLGDRSEVDLLDSAGAAW